MWPSGQKGQKDNAQRNQDGRSAPCGQAVRMVRKTQIHLTPTPCRKKRKVPQPGDWRANRTRPQYKTHPIATQTVQDPNRTPKKTPETKRTRLPRRPRTTPIQQDPNRTPKKDSKDKTDPIGAQTAHDPSTTPQKDSRERRLARQILRQHINNENKFQIQNNYKTNPL